MRTFDASAKRAELLKSYQDRALQALKIAGAVPMATGVVRALPPPSSGADILGNLELEVVRGLHKEGPRFLDRHSTNAESTYRNTRFRTLASLNGVQRYATDEKGRRVRKGLKEEGAVKVGLGFDMDRDGARKDWKNVFADQVDYDSVRSGDRPLNTEEIQRLFDYDIIGLEDTITQVAGDSVLAENQRLALLSASLYSGSQLLARAAPYLQMGDFAGVTDVLLRENYTPATAHRNYATGSMFAKASDLGNSVPDFPTYKKGIAEGIPSRAEIVDYIRQSAQSRGINPDTAVAVARSEGLNGNPANAWQSSVVKNGKRERSYGPFQLYIDGGLGNKFMSQTGLDPRDPKTVYKQIDFALDNAKKTGWTPWYGARAIGLSQWSGINRT